MTSVVVVVPARDEAAHVTRTLRGVCASLDAAQRAGVVDHARLEVAAHRCRDDTEQLARAVLAHRDDSGVSRDLTSATVGQVRDLAARRGLAALPSTPRETWLLSTDADTVVGPGWVRDLLEQAQRARAVAVAGLAPLDRWRGGHDGLAAYQRVLAAKMRAGDEPLREHDHVYGANLAVRADAYLTVGGFSHVLHGEDQALVDALLASGHPVLRTRSITVRTSGRLHGRADDGLASYLAGLDVAARGQRRWPQRG